MIEWLGQRVGVYGYGRTGRACVEYLVPRLLTPVVLVDEMAPEDAGQIRAEAAGRFDLVVGEEIPQVIENLDSLILSPGVPCAHPNAIRAKTLGVQVIGELELAARNCPGFIIAVTGTNGKSTTTKLLGHVLSALGPAHVLGNIGSPLLGSLDLINQNDFIALEVSSFQLESVQRFTPQIAIYTNLTPDHLDRHKTIEEYAHVKRKMTAHMKSDGFVVTNALCDEFAPRCFQNHNPTYLQYRSTPGNMLRGAWIGNGKIHVDLGHEQYELPQHCVKLPGKHNLENALAVVIASLLVGATPETASERIASFTGYEHRLELCRRDSGISFYNDSKATNPEATITALRAIEPPLALILGGRDKMTDLADLVGLVRRRVKLAVLFGEAQERFAESLDNVGYNNYRAVSNLEEAVQVAVAAVKGSGGTVLLSPACASFDQYSSYEARGDHFKQLVARLKL